MFLLAYRNLRARLGRTLFTAFAIALGVALVFATRIVSVAADQQAQAARDSKLAGADLEVSPARAQFFPVSIADEILKNSAVEKTAPVYKHTLTESNLILLGVDPARVLTPYELIAGEDLTGFENLSGLVIWLPDTWAAQHGLGVGQTVRLTIRGEAYEYKVVGLLKAQPFGTPTAWLPLPTLQAALHTPDAANSILVRLKPGAALTSAKATLTEALGTAYIVTTAQDTALALQGPAALTGMAFPFASVMVLLSGAYLIYNTFAITLAERKREIGQLRALGMTRGQVRAQTLTEALLIAGAGSLLGLPLGLGLAVVLVRSVIAADAGTDAAVNAGGLTFANVAIPLDGVVLAVGVGVVVTLATTFTLAWQAGRASPLAALLVESSNKDSSAARLYEKWGWVGALGLALLFGVTNVIAARSASQSDVGELGSFFVFIPILLPPFIVLLAIPAAMRGGLWAMTRAFPRTVAVRLAAGSIRQQKARALLTAAMFAISLMLVVAFAGMAEGLATVFASPVAPLIADDFWLLRQAAPGETLFPPIPADLETDLAALRAEAQVFDVANTGVPGYDLGSGSDVFVVGVDYLRAHPDALIPLEGSLAEAEQYIAAGPTLLLPEIAARRHNLHVGDPAPVDTLAGPVTFTVGLIHNGGFTFLPLEYGPLYFGVYPGSFLVSALPGHDPAALADRLNALAQKHNLLVVDDPEQWWGDAVGQVSGAILGLFAGLTSLSGLIAGLNLVNLLVASVLERQRELGTLRALGLTQAQVRALVVVEAGLLSLVGSLLGVVGALAISSASVQLLAAWFKAVFGPLTEKAAPLPWAMASLTLLLGPGIAMLAALWPADRAASVNPADAMRAEGSTGFLKAAKHLGPTGVRGLLARLPLSAKLSFSLGVIFVLTVAILTTLRVDYERRLIEDNMRAIIARGFDVLNSSDAFKPDLDELNSATIVEMQKLAGLQADTLQAQFRGGDSPFEFTLKYLFIADDQDKVLLSNRADAEGNNTLLTDTVEFVGSASVVRLTDWTGERVFEAAVPIENKTGKRIGSLRLGFSTEPVDNITRNIIQSSLLTMAAALAIAVILTIVITRRALAPMTQIADASRAVARGDLARRVPETRWDDVGQLARAFNEMVSGLNDRERMRDLFGRYLSREVSEAVLAGRVTLGGERKTITCLYVDMRGSTAFAEQHAPEEVMEALNQYFEVIVLSVEAHGGIVNRFVGDEAVCVFGAPTGLRDHAERAVQAALSMREGLAYLNHKRSTLNLPTLKFGIGLNTGEVVAGATGSEERQEYTVIGDAMNLGARIQDLTKTFPDYDILLSEFTLAELGENAGNYAFADLGPVEIRGKSLPVRVFGLV